MERRANNACGQCGGCCGRKQPPCRQGCCGSCGRGNREITLTEGERDFLYLLETLPFLPLARFIKRSTNPDQPDVEALAPVFLYSPDDPPDAVRKTGAILRSLEAKRLITLDYDKPLVNGDYSMYESSGIYQVFVREAANGAQLPVMERGSIALTALGQEALDSLSVIVP